MCVLFLLFQSILFFYAFLSVINADWVVVPSTEVKSVVATSPMPVKGGSTIGQVIVSTIEVNRSQKSIVSTNSLPLQVIEHHNLPIVISLVKIKGQF